MEYKGILPIWKEKGMTSHDVVMRLRRILRMKKIGHTGTLDPDVDGVLAICLGRATKLVPLLMDSDKVYVGEVTLGFSTETEDASGEVVASHSMESEVITNEIVDKAMLMMCGQIQQIPPYYSAVKVNGRRLYEYARQNIEVERPIREVMIHEFKRTSDVVYHEDNQTYTFPFYVRCSKGTYVRTLAVDLGRQLGYPSHMSYLTRLETSGCHKEQCVTLEQVEQLVDDNALESYIQSIETILQKYPSIELQPNWMKAVENGQVLEENYFGKVIDDSTVLTYNGRVLAIYAPHPTKHHLIKPTHMFHNS